MASIKDIMNVDADQQGPPHPNNKKDKDSGTPASGTRGHDPSTSSTPSSHVNRSGQHIERNTSPAASQGKKRTASSRVSRSGATASSSSRPTAARRRSTTSTDSMDQPGYGSAASSSSMGGLGGGGGGMNPNYPTRPMPQAASGDIPIKLTPITGRVSRAKKGVPVHTCDLCKPPKTFTRAEHLRRHQLSHQTPGYPCTFPGCDRTFHRPDLLARHQQRHEQEGDKASGHGGDDGSRRTSSASVSASLDERMPRLGLGLQAPAAFSSNPAGLGGTSTPSTSTSDMPSTPNMQHNSAAYHHGTSPGSATGSTMSPPMTGGGEHYGSSVGGNRPSQGPYGGSSYELASTIPVIQHPPNLGAAPTFNNVDYHQPRNPPAIPLFLVTQNLSPTSIQMAEGPPELLHTQDASPWTSASDNSTYSTPSEPLNRPPRYWGVSTRRHQSPSSTDWHTGSGLLSPYPPPAQRDVHNPSGGLEAMPTPYYFNHTFPPSPHIASSRHPAYGPMLDVPITTGFTDDQTHHVLMDPTSQSHHYHPNSSVRSPTPPPSSVPTSTQSAETLVTPAAALPADRIGMMAQLSRQKEVAIGGVDVSMGGIFSMSGGNSPNWGSSSPGASILAMPGMGSVGACMPGITMVMPLPRTVRNAIPSYLEVYWTRFHDVYPIVHRRSVEGAGEDVLSCAMAAIATQFLESKEDRLRGSQLHDYAWQEAKRYPQWTLPVMQAILLCELFARFRGRKAVTRPSKPFESLYSRVSESESQSFISSSHGGMNTPSSSPRPLRAGSLSSSPAAGASFSSSGGFLSWSSSSPLSPASSRTPTPIMLNLNLENLEYNTGNMVGQHETPLLFSPSISSFPEYSLFEQPETGQPYLDMFSSQVSDHNTSLFDPAPMDGGVMTREDRWQTWLDAEARRRLLTACFVIDAHTAIYHEQPRMRLFDFRSSVPIPLTGPSKDLWEAQSADDWAAILDANPAIGSPQFLPHPDTLTPENIAVRPAFDRLAILAAEAMRLPRHPPSNPDPSSLLGTPEPGADAEQDFVATTAAAALRAEERINYLFPNSPTANAYLALHHTPLHDLLAVSGDSWVFSQKVLHPTNFQEHQKRLKIWAEQHGRGGSLPQTKPGSGGSSTFSSAAGDGAPFTKSVAKATIFAARALVAFLSPSDNGPSPWQKGCISDYWALYVCALICWAFGHRINRGNNDASRASNTNDEDALAWLRMVAEMRPEEVTRVRGRREVIGVVNLVRRRLEIDCVGGRSRLYVDAVGVLRKLEEGMNWKWF